MIRLWVVQWVMEMRLLMRTPAHLATLCAAAISMYLSLRFGLPVNEAISAIPALLIAVLTLCLLHVTQESFVQDAQQDRLSQWHTARLTMEWMVLSRWMAHMVASALPLVVCFVIIMSNENKQIEAIHSAIILYEMAALAIACGLMGGALVLCFHASAGLAQLISLPFLFSIIIFAADALTDMQTNASLWVHALTLLLTPMLCWITAKLL
jgi:heme exporter protein CcmB